MVLVVPMFVAPFFMTPLFVSLVANPPLVLAFPAVTPVVIAIIRYGFADPERKIGSRFGGLLYESKGGHSGEQTG